MKAVFKTICVLSLVLGDQLTAFSQQATRTGKLSMAAVAPYDMQVTYNKTSHLIFPAAIRYVDLGSGYLVAGKAADAENVLRVKAAVQDFPGETNFSVITGDGMFYHFNVGYSTHPDILSYDLLKIQKAPDRANGNDVLFEALGENPPSVVGLAMETIYNRNKRMMKHIGSRSDGIQFSLKGIYVHSGKLYFHTELRNKTDLPFEVEFVNFKVVDKKVAKRTVVQEKLLAPLRMHRPLGTVAGNSVERNVFLLDRFSLAGDKVLVIEIFEKNGGRQQCLQVKGTELVHAKRIADMHPDIHDAKNLQQ
ncbi:MAG: conjugative transposon protein TraN [Chitinophagaceae bacterium]